MMKKTKIIHLLTHLPHPVILKHKNPLDYFHSISRGDFQQIDYPPYWVGFFSEDHHVLAAQELISFTDEFEIECWRPYGYGIKHDYKKTVNGIVHRVFPGGTFTIPMVGNFTWSSSLYRALVEEIQSNNVILNVYVGHNWFPIILIQKLKKLKSRFGLIETHLSSGFKKFSYYKLDWWKRLFKWYYLIEHYLDVNSLKKCDHYYSGSFVEAKYLKVHHPDVSSSFFMAGIDFSKFKVLSKPEKIKLREELDLPTNKNILIAQGNWRSIDYGYQHLIECYKKVKQSGRADNLQLVMIGGYKTEDLYEVGLKAKAIMVERCPKSQFYKYLEAADFFTKASFGYIFINFGGFGFATIEALACGLPMISNNIIHYPGTDEERNGIGVEMPTKEKLIEAMISMNENYPNYTSCRELAKKYFNIENTRLELVSKYRELSAKYFKVN
jgi:glycosyltransferase involved in cell wall biosynthesis